MKTRSRIAIAVAASLLAANIASASYVLPIYGANGELFANLTVVQPTDDYDPDYAGGEAVT